MKTIRPDNTILESDDRFTELKDVYTVDGWYELHHDGLIAIYYLINSKIIGIKNGQDDTYIFYPSDLILNSKEEFERYVRLMVFT